MSAPTRPPESRTSPRRVSAAACLLAVLLASPARAADPAPIADNGYAVEMHVGPVVGSSRVIGLGGAYVGLADGAEGLSQNPASAAGRRPYSFGRVDYDFAFDFYLTGFLGRNDFDLSGGTDPAARSALVTAAASVQFGRLALAVDFMGQQRSLAVENGTELDATTALADLGLGYGFADGQLLVGLSGRIPAMSVTRRADGEELLSLTASDLTWGAGLLWRPDDRQYRLGASFFLPTTADQSDGRAGEDQLVRVGGLLVPSQVVMPWRLSLGAALQLGDKVLNKPWQNPRAATSDIVAKIKADRRSRTERHRASLAALAGDERRAEKRRFEAQEEKLRAEEDELVESAEEAAESRSEEEYRRAPRRYALVSAALQITGGSAQPATGMAGFLAQRLLPAGEKATFQPSLGFELEPWPDRLCLRTGVYYEPSRFADVNGRFHATGGFELRVLDLADVWLPTDARVSLSAIFDVAGRYANTGLSLGLWH